MAKKIKLAEALLRRKELQQKVDQLAKINVENLFRTKVQRVAKSDGIDEVIAAVPRITAAEVARGYDYYAKRLRLVDAAIQNANWTTDVPVDATVMDDYEAPQDQESPDPVHLD